MPDYYWNERTLLGIQEEESAQEGTGQWDVTKGTMLWETPFGAAKRAYERPDFFETAEKDFEPTQYITEEDKAKYSSKMQLKLNLSRSESEQNYWRDQADGEMAFNENVRKHGVTGFLNMMVTATLGDITTYIGGGTAWLSKGSRLARARKAGVIAGTSNALVEETLRQQSAVKDASDVAYALLGGLAIGGAAGAAVAHFDPMRMLDPVTKKVYYNRLDKNRKGMEAVMDKGIADEVAEGTLDMQEAVRLQHNYHALMEDGSVGAMKRAEGVFAKRGIYDQGTQEDAIWFGVSNANIMNRTLNGSMGKIANKLLETPGVRKVRESTAALRRDMHVAKLNEAHPQIKAAFDAWAKAENINLFGRNFSLKTVNRFNREVRAELTERYWKRTRDYSGQNEGAGEAIGAAADAHDHSTGLAAEMQHRSGLAEDLQAQSGYFHRRWSSRRIFKYAEEFERMGLNGRETMQGWLKKGLSKAVDNLGMKHDDEMLDEIAKAISDRFMEQAKGGDTNKLASLNADSREFILESLKDKLSKEKLESVEKFLAGEAGKKAKPGHLKETTLIDLSAEIELPDGRKMDLHDLLEGDLQRNLASQNRKVGGHVAMAEAGYKTEADFNSAIDEAKKEALDNWKALGYKSADKAIDAAAKEEKILQFTRRQLTGEVLWEETNKWTSMAAAHIKDMTALTSLGAMGIPQLAETARIISQIGLMNTIHAIPALKMMFKQCREGTLPDAWIMDLEAASGFRIGKDYDRNPYIIRDEWGGQDAFGTAAGMDQTPASYIYETSMHKLKTGLAYASGHRFIQEAQHLVQMRGMARKFQQMALEGGEKNMKRMQDIGLDKKQLQAVINQIKKHTEQRGPGSLHVEHWPNAVKQPFLEALHRANSIAIQRQLIGETNSWMHSHLGELMTQFRTFPIVAMEKQTAREMRMMDSETAQVVIYSAALGSALYCAKMAMNTGGMNHQDRQDYLDDHLTPAGIAAGASQMMGVVATGSDMLDVMLKATGGATYFETRGIGQSYDQKLDLIGMVPAAGKLKAVSTAISDAARYMIAPEDNAASKHTQGKHKNYFRAALYGNSFPMKWIMNMTMPDE